MPDRIAVLFFALAASLVVPTAAGLSLDAPQAEVVQDLPGAPATPVLDQTMSIPDVGVSTPDVAVALATDVSANGLDGIALATKATIEVAPEMPSKQGTAAEDASGLSPQAIGGQIVDVAAPVAGASLIALAIAALTMGAEGLRLLQARLGRLLVGLLPAVGLFSRIERGSLLDNPIRARVHDVVAQDPGLSLSEITARAGIAWGTAVHHLRRLETHGLVVSVSQLAHRRYFIANSAASAQRAAVSVVMHPTARRIAHLVSQRPGIDQTGICQALGLNNPAASKHLSQFQAQGLVLSQRAGRSRLYHATGGLHSALLLLEPTATRMATPQALANAPTAVL